MNVTLSQFQAIFPKTNYVDQWFDDFQILEDHDISTPEQLSMFFAQVGHESSGLNVLEENLNYSEKGLMRVFPRYFRNTDIASYSRNPQRIANRVYANRMGNGSESSGDGWKHRGKGLIHITGKDNHLACSRALYGDESILRDDPNLLFESRSTALESALWFWRVNGLNEISNIVTSTRRINGGENGLDDRISRYNTALAILRG